MFNWLTRNTKKVIFSVKTFKNDIFTDNTYSYEPREIIAEFKEFDDVLYGKLLRVDKSLLIKDLLDRKSVLITRPRRWGKSLNLDMLKSFFQPKFSPEGHIINDDQQKKNFSKLLIGSEVLENHPFTGKAEKTKIIDLQGTIPVISLNFDSIANMSVDGINTSFIDLLRDGIEPHRYLLHSPKIPSEDYKKILTKYLFQGINTLQTDDITRSLDCFIKSLNNHHNRKVILLVDEYDKILVQIKTESPNLYLYALNLYKKIFSVVKNNSQQVQLSVFTGVSRISKEDIFSGINNFYHDSVVDSSINRTGEHYGFTEAEVNQLIRHVIRISKIKLDEEKIKQQLSQYYNGYKIGNTLVYNPWTVMNCLDRLAYDKLAYQNFWLKSGDPTFITNAIKEHRKIKENENNQTNKNNAEINKIETLIKSGQVKFKPIEGINFDKIYNDQVALLTLMLDAGYLTSADNLIEYKIPNYEVRYEFFTRIINAWFNEEDQNLLNLTLDQNEFEDARKFIEIFQDRILKYLKQEKYPEFFFQSMLFACLNNESYFGSLDYRTSNNRRIDILIWPSNNSEIVYIVEVKKNGKNSKEVTINDDLIQILEKKYAEDIIKTNEKFNMVIIRVIYFEMDKDSKWNISMAELKFTREKFKTAIECFVPKKDSNKKIQEVENQEKMNNKDIFNDLKKYAIEYALVN